MPAGYGVVLIFWYAYYGVLFSFSLGLVFLALLPLTFLLGRSAQFVKELTPFIVLLMSYGSSSLFSELARIGSLIESDKLAAFPSLHAAYVVLFSYFTIKLKRAYVLVSVPITVGVLFSTIYLGQHYITDLVAGVAVAATCVLIVTRLDRGKGSAKSTDWKALKPTGPESAT